MHKRVQVVCWDNRIAELDAVLTNAYKYLLNYCDAMGTVVYCLRNETWRFYRPINQPRTNISSREL